MSFNFAKVKAFARRTVHSTLGVQALYEDSTTNGPVCVTARWHNKIDRMGDIDNQSYAELIQGIDRVIFEAEVARNYNMKRGGTITFPEYESAKFTLHVREPSSGPFEEVWEVALKEVPL